MEGPCRAYGLCEAPRTLMARRGSGHGSALGKHHWVEERTISWLNQGHHHSATNSPECTPGTASTLSRVFALKVGPQESVTVYSPAGT